MTRTPDQAPPPPPLPRVVPVAPDRPALLAPQRLWGLQEGWSAGLALFEAPHGFERTTIPRAHTLCFPLRTTPMERMDGRAAGRRSREGLREITLMPAGGSQHFQGPPGSAWGQIYFEPGRLREVASELRGSAPAALDLRDDAAFIPDTALRRRLDAYLARARDRLEPPITLEMDARALLIAIDLLRRYSTLGAVRPTPRHGLGTARFRRIEEHVEAHLGEDLSLAALAELVGLSPKHFARAFRASTGQPPHRWLVERRIREAQRLLREGALPLAEIAASLGFADQSHFTATFRRVTGLTPGAYRRSLRE